jgi:type IV pilus assembly protein PilQ
VKQVHGKNSKNIVFGIAATLSLATQPILFFSALPAVAQSTQITGIKLNAVDGAVKVVLDTNAGDRPQIFTTQRGNTLVADIINTQLRLPNGKSFRQDNPTAGITSVTVNQLDGNSIRVMVTGNAAAPETQPVQRANNSLTLGFTPGAITAQVPVNAPAEASAPVNSPNPSDNNNPKNNSGALPTNPQLTVENTPAPALGPGQASTQIPPSLPRAVAPPVGDIAVSNTDASASVVDLGTQERVPRLVLRDAPVREVLSLLARAAGLNLAYTNITTGPGGQVQQVPGQAGNDGPTISLDIQNEPVQDVFNYVLRLSGLEANRSGRTIFVGTKLPNSTRDVIMRSLRLNQVSIGVALNYLVGLGAESAVSRERQVTNVSAVPVGGAANAITQTQTTTETRLETQRIDFQDSNPLLRGLQALGDERSNAVTLIGPPRLVEIAIAQLSQLDIRRRQVAVNVKIIDVNLSNQKNFNSSFSFGINSNFFVNDGGAAALNFGGVRPANSSDLSSSVTNPPTITNPLANSAPFFSANDSVSIPGTAPGTEVTDANGNTRITQNPGSAQFYKPVAPIGENGNPLTPGFSNITPATNNVITIGADGQPTVARGTLGSATAALPSLFQFPKRLLASLQAQVQTGNAKILTDPTLIVQEGQTANVNLTQQVVGNLKREITRGDGTSTETVTAEKENVGLTLAVKVDRIDDNGFVSLSVAPNVKAPQSPENINLGSGGSQRIFLVSERSLNSGLVRLRDGQTLILSGIIQDADRTSVSKIPILGDIPLLGALFRRTDRTNERREVIVLLTPQVMDDSERSSFGYNYQPSPDVRGVLERGGLKTPKR